MDVEILIIDDGSTDSTAALARQYEESYPGIVKVYHQDNGGHGAAVMTGIKHASGCFTKVVDSDDWVEPCAYEKILDALRSFPPEGLPDMVISNFVYEKAGKKYKKTVRYVNALPVERIFTWDEVGRFRKGQYLLMHSIIYQTELIKNCGLELPRHTFYVDNLYAFLPLRDVRTMYYLDVDFYRYFIGREGQSVQEATMIERIDQQLHVNRLMCTKLDLREIENKHLREYLFSYLEIVTTISSVLLQRSGTEENIRKKRELWGFIRSHNRSLYYKLRYRVMGQLVNLPGTAGRGISSSVYKVTRKVVGFN
jgi:glycosyltransferase involved in cell wall biosynthesis